MDYSKLSKIRTSPIHYDQLRKIEFAIIRQLGPSTFFVTFTTDHNNWLEIIQTLEELQDIINYNKETIYKNNDKQKNAKLI